MTPEEYQERLNSLGISRGALDQGFTSLFTATGSQEENFLTGRALGEIEKPPMEDLTSLNDPRHEQSQKNGAIRHSIDKPKLVTRGIGYRRRPTEIRTVGVRAGR